MGSFRNVDVVIRCSGHKLPDAIKVKRAIIVTVSRVREFCHRLVADFV